MKIVSIKQNHDGAVAYIEDGKLVFSIEQEKQCSQRHSSLSFANLARVLHEKRIEPDVFAVSGWARRYYGLESPMADEEISLQNTLKLFLSSHERSHVMVANGKIYLRKNPPENS